MVVGTNVDIGDILNLLGIVVVGRFYGKAVSSIYLQIWVDGSWSNILGYLPDFHTLTRGWICSILSVMSPSTPDWATSHNLNLCNRIVTSPTYH